MKPFINVKSKSKYQNFAYNALLFNASLTPIRRPFFNKKNDNDKPKSTSNMLGAAAVGATFIFGKTKYLLIGLKFTKALPLASMLFTSFVYSFVFGWPYAIGLVSLIFVHEAGHAVVLRYYKIPFTPAIFVPFVGAAIYSKQLPRTAYESAIIALGGPILGTLGAGAVGLTGIAYDSQLLFALADFGYLINLMNLLPIGALDGGKIGEAISPYANVVGVGAGGALIYYSIIDHPIMYLILLMGAYSSGKRLLGWNDESEYPKDFFKTTRSEQAKLISAYLALISSLLFAINENNKYRKSPQELKGDVMSFEDVKFD
jgi:Zn-dependent protease